MIDFNVARRPTQLNLVCCCVYSLRSIEKCWNPGPLGNSNIWSNPISNTNFLMEVSMKCIPLFYKTSCKWNEGSSNRSSMVRTLFGLEKKTSTMWCRSFFFPISISIFLLCIPNNEQLKTRAYLALCIETLRMIESVLELWHFQRSVHYERQHVVRVVELHKICQFYLDI